MPRGSSSIALVYIGIAARKSPSSTALLPQSLYWVAHAANMSGFPISLKCSSSSSARESSSSSSGESMASHAPAAVDRGTSLGAWQKKIKGQDDGRF